MDFFLNGCYYSIVFAHLSKRSLYGKGEEMRVIVVFLWTIAAVVLTVMAGRSVTADINKTGTYQQFDTSWSLVISDTANVGASSVYPVYLYRQGTDETITGLPTSDGYVAKPRDINPGLWLNPAKHTVSYTITTDKPLKITLIDNDPTGDWIMTVIIAIIVWAMISAYILIA